MKKFTPLAIVLALGLAAGCSDDEGTNGGGGTTLPRVVAAASVTAPSMQDAADPLWAGITTTTVTVSGTNVPKPSVPGKAAAVPASMQVQALVNGADLYMRLRWADPTYDAYPAHYTVNDAEPPIGFIRNTLAEEDQIYVMFQGPTAGDYDVWCWQALRTAGAGVGKGYTYSNDVLTEDAEGTVVLPAALENKELGFSAPRWLPEDSSDFTGPVLYLQNSVLRTDLMNSTGWAVGDTIPGWVIDSALTGATHTDEQRGSIWDLRTISAYDGGGSRYALVFKGPLNSGYADDYDFSAIDSIQVMVGVFDNQNDFNLGGTHRGFSQRFWLILP